MGRDAREATLLRAAIMQALKVYKEDADIVFVGQTKSERMATILENGLNAAHKAGGQ